MCLCLRKTKRRGHDELQAEVEVISVRGVARRRAELSLPAEVVDGGRHEAVKPVELGVRHPDRRHPHRFLELVNDGQDALVVLDKPAQWLGTVRMLQGLLSGSRGPNWNGERSP
jgi:hypothetical protein